MNGFMVLRTLSSALLSLIFASVLFFGLTSTVSAQGTGVGLKPAITEELAQPGVPQQHSIEVTNLSGVTQTYYLFMRDITGTDGGGTPVFASENSEKTGFEMSHWVTLDKTEMTVPAGGNESVLVTLDVPEDATPGSHFAGMFVSMEPPEIRGQGASVGYEVASIFSIRVAGDVVESAQIRQFSTGNYIYGESTVDFQARVENKGTVLVRPVGPLEITNMFGSQVARLTFNDSKAGIFPGKEREFEIVWEDDGPGFGRYEAVLALQYGIEGSLSTITSTVSFWILPRDIIVPALLTLGLLLLVTFVAVKLYVRSKLRSAQAGATRVVRYQGRGGGMSATLLVVIVMLAVTALFLLLLLAIFA